MRYYKRCNNAYYKCCCKPQENRLAYRSLYRAKVPPFLHPILDTLERLIKKLVQESNTNNEKKKRGGFLKPWVMDIIPECYWPKKQAAERQNYVVVTLETTIAGDATIKWHPFFTSACFLYSRRVEKKLE